MGIKKLPKLIKDIAGDAAIRSYKFSKFKGWAVSVDASLIIHQTVIALRSSGRDMKNSKGELTSHLHGLFYKILIFLQNGMVPIFVFDGKAPDIKNKTIEKRKQRKTQAQKNLDELTDSEDEEYIKNFKQTFKPTKADIKEAQILLDLMGIPYIIAPGEADVVCAWLAARHDASGKRYVKGVCSDDSDMLALGAPYLFKDMLRFMSKNKPVKVISLKKALVKMNLTMDQFVDLCVLLGTDYCDNIKGIGPKGAYKLIQKYGTLEKVLASLNKNSDSDGSESDCSDDDCMTNEQCMIEAKKYFKNALKEIDESEDFVITDDQLQLRKFQYEELMDFMCVKHNFDVIRIQTGIDRLKEYHKKMNVTRENNKNVHKILQPRSENYIFKALTEDIEFLSSDDENDKISQENTDSTEEEVMPSKKTTSKKEIFKKTKIASDSEDEEKIVSFKHIKKNNQPEENKKKTKKPVIIKKSQNKNIISNKKS
ncbi:endonuclease of the XPG family [Tupanvirus soda lake]|uniref:Endonuclease of the XPG family n=2 Tax=Tupanvirus TaxID=2094720 RepID=A0A6N1NKJ4_9VIRU|nr:endonuclease of the XPG family [Tupanvirus soda lake]QKU35219.1 endonuclease of the XPG family [Tupanvirus soda lake]